MLPVYGIHPGEAIGIVAVKKKKPIFHCPRQMQIEGDGTLQHVQAILKLMFSDVAIELSYDLLFDVLENCEEKLYLIFEMIKDGPLSYAS